MSARNDRWSIPTEELVNRLVRECIDLGHSPTLEQWDAAVRPALEAAANDATDVPRANEAARVLAAWHAAIKTVHTIWEQSHRVERESIEHPHDADEVRGEADRDLDEDWRS